MRHVENQQQGQQRESCQQPAGVEVRNKEDAQTDRVVGTDGSQEIALMSPAHGALVTRHLHPDTVHTIFWDDGDGSNDNRILAEDKEAVAGFGHALAPVHGSFFLQEEAICMNQEIGTDAIGTQTFLGTVWQLTSRQQQAEGEEAEGEKRLHDCGARTSI